MSENLSDKFTAEVDVADWSMLEDHYKRGAVVIVSPKLDLVDVAKAVAEDEVDSVKDWLRAGDLKNAGEDEAKAWGETPYEKIVEFLIVQPYVLVQLIRQ